MESPTQVAEAFTRLVAAEQAFRTLDDPTARRPLAREILHLRTALDDYMLPAEVRAAYLRLNWSERR
jgi:hypothetical protein